MCIRDRTQAVAVQRAPQHEGVRAAAGAELFRDVGRHARVGGGRGREHRHTGREVGEHGAQPAVVRPEVVAPVGDAVGLVHHQEPGGGCEPGQHLVPEVRVVEPLRTDQQDVHLTRGDLVLNRLPLLGVRGVDGPGVDAGPGRRLDLVPHESEQRGDDHRRTAALRPQQ